MAISDNGGVIYGADYGNSGASGVGAGIFKSVTAPTSQPSIQPSSQPSRQPSSQPSIQPTMQPSSSPSYYTVAVSINIEWTGPQSGTNSIGWLSITSDSQGINLAAGIRNSGKFINRY